MERKRAAETCYNLLRHQYGHQIARLDSRLWTLEEAF